MPNVQALLDSDKFGKDKESLLRELCEFIDQNNLAFTPEWKNDEKILILVPTTPGVGFPAYRRTKGAYALFLSKNGTGSNECQMAFEDSPEELQLDANIYKELGF